MRLIRPVVATVRRCSTRAGASTTHFGYEEVAEDEKAERVRGVFDSVATRYDLMNDAMSLYVQRHWKHHFVRQIPLSRVPSIDGQQRYIDVAAGTGDIAYAVVRRLQQRRRRVNVTLVDINEAMLEVAKEKAVSINVHPSDTLSLEWLTADAEKLPFPDNSCSLYTIAFGIRNCTHVERVLEEAHRVLAPGGIFACLEFSAPSSPVLQSVYNWYSFNIIPPLGQIIAGDWRSYQYLVESIRRFPNQALFARMIMEAGFEEPRVENMSCGIVAISIAQKKKL